MMRYFKEQILSYFFLVRWLSEFGCEIQMVIIMPRTRLFGTMSLKPFNGKYVKSRSMSFTITNYGVNMLLFEAVFMVKFK